MYQIAINKVQCLFTMDIFGLKSIYILFLTFCSDLVYMNKLEDNFDFNTAFETEKQNSQQVHFM